MTARDVRQSLFPDLVPDRPVGRMVGSVVAGTNADLIATIAPLYLQGRSVLDVTYGQGHWWRRFRPAELYTHDLAGDGVDFRALPEPDRSVDVVCFDPPYLPQGGTTADAFTGRYGLTPRTQIELDTLIAAGLGECARVARTFVLAKCTDYVNASRFHLGHVTMIEAAARHGCTTHDLIVHWAGAGPGGHQISEAIRARRHHSYLLVFQVGRTGVR